LITLGIDPGTARLGYGLVEAATDPILIDFGVIETAASVDMPSRLSGLYDAVTTLISTHHPDVLAVEQLIFARNVTTAITVGQARGVVLLAAARGGIAIAEYSPSEVKHAVTGYGKADKSQIQEMVRIILGMKFVPTPDDAADALAVALCHTQRAAFAERTGSPSW